MLTIRKSVERGHANHGWLDTYHTFSFDTYRDPAHMGFKSLRVINEDRVEGGQGFGTHPHRDMEIITYILEGALVHKDSMGSGGEIRPGDVQRMSAGTGVTHSEFNASPTIPVHLLQIWILPAKRSTPPSHEQKRFTQAERHNRLRLVASHDARDGSILVQQDVSLYASILDPNQVLRHTLAPGHSAWVQVAKGAIKLNGTALSAGDGAAVTGETTLMLDAANGSEILLFDLA